MCRLTFNFFSSLLCRFPSTVIAVMHLLRWVPSISDEPQHGWHGPLRHVSPSRMFVCFNSLYYPCMCVYIYNGYLCRLPRGRNQMQYYNQCQEMPPHMQRGHCYPDDFNKMGGPCSYVYIFLFINFYSLNYGF